MPPKTRLIYSIIKIVFIFLLLLPSIFASKRETKLGLHLNVRTIWKSSICVCNTHKYVFKSRQQKKLANNRKKIIFIDYECFNDLVKSNIWLIFFLAAQNGWSIENRFLPKSSSYAKMFYKIKIAPFSWINMKIHLS